MVNSKEKTEAKDNKQKKKHTKNILMAFLSNMLLFDCLCCRNIYFRAIFPFSILPSILVAFYL